VGSLEVLCAHSQNSQRILTRSTTEALSKEIHRTDSETIRDSASIAKETPSQETVWLYEFGPLRLYPAERKLQRGKKIVALTPKAFDTLHLLVRNSGHLLEKDDLIRMLWPDTVVEEGSLSNNIFLLRKALGRNLGFIQTVPKRGYRFVGAVRQFPRTAPTHLEKPPEVGATGVASIAVLPFVFLTEVEERKALSLGFADALITMLSNLEDVVVRPTSDILRYAAGADPSQVCRDLGIRYVLQGNVQRLGVQWRVSMHLFDATTQKITFSEKHDFVLEDIFEVQDEIGRRVVELLQTRFPLAAPTSRSRYSSDPAAYDEFMSGLRDSYASRLEILEGAIQHLSRAVELDPEFALAHATLSYVSMNMHFEFDPQHTWLEKAEHHCRRALELDPTLPEGHLARAWILWSPAKNFQHVEAIAALEQVLAKQPNNERAHNRVATICLHIGRLQEARIAHERAQRSSRKTRSLNLYMSHLYRGDFARLEEAAEAYMREEPGAAYALQVHALSPLYSGNLDLAEQRLAEALKQLPDEPLVISLQGILHARRNQTVPALECVRRALDSPRSFGHTHHTYYQIACVCAVLGETQKAMAWLERAAETGFPCWPFFKLDPHLENLCEILAFRELVADLEHKYTAIRIQRL
jgi:DNA-binding winged helix-turn-helix (wHTH) protein/tetratricopeptide (TPR) repeat protein